MSNSILLLDDDHDILSIFKTILEEEGYKVYTGNNAEQAKAIVTEQEVNLVIMDYYPRNTNGVKIAEALKRIDENLQIIFLTGYISILDTVEDVGFKVDRVLIKPVSVIDLLREIRNVFDIDAGYRQASIPYKTIVSGRL